MSTRPQSFSLQLLIGVWNSVNGGFRIGQYEDISSVSYGIMGHLPLPDTNNGIPVLTRYKANYTCHRCGNVEQNLLNWVRTRLCDTRGQTVGDSLIGNLISCVSHMGHHQAGHYVSYHRAGNLWFRNSDSCRILGSSLHPFNCMDNQETANFIVYQNNYGNNCSK